MRFVDEVTIEVKAGDGGNGCVAFRREAHVPRGGPSGGDGGRGGDIVFEANAQLSTLLDLRYAKHVRAERGVGGKGSDRHGRRGDTRVVAVPCGTLVYDADSGELLADLVDVGAHAIVARGGRGGRGNASFATASNRAPRQSEEGHKGEQRRLRLELKLLAEVGLVGLPNAGKSTLISRLSAARPKIADYPFTTLVPQLGIVRLSEERSFVMADIPGLIEGAAEGAGLGHRFLRHIERTRVLVFLVDDRRHELDGSSQGSPLDDLAALRGELAAYDPQVARKPSVVVLNKIDSLSAARREEIARQCVAQSVTVLPISAVVGDGLSELLAAIGQQLETEVEPLTTAAQADAANDRLT